MATDQTPETALTGIITIVVPDDIELAHKLYKSFEAFTRLVVPDFSGVVSLRFEDQKDQSDE